MAAIYVGLNELMYHGTYCMHMSILNSIEVTIWCQYVYFFKLIVISKNLYM